MKKGYWMVSVDVTEPESYPQYVAANRVAFEKYGARFLARGGRNEIVEGAAGARNVIIEFDSFEQALACYNSAEYQQALKLRLAAATATLVIVEGV
jgi:uncharacterized protein (DUF1330 family)